MKTRTIILGIIILIVGFLLGMLTSAQLRLQKLRPVRMYFSEEKFREGFYKVIQPDDEQKVKIDLILDKYARLNSETQNNFKKEFEATRKAMRKELDSNLTKEQLARLKEMDERRQEMMKQDRERFKNDSLNQSNGRAGKPRRNGDSPEFHGPPPPYRDKDSV